MQVQNQTRRSFEPLNSYDGSLANKAYLSIKNAIMTLEYRPGDILRKGEVCDALGISRSPVSEAITRLANEGLVNIVPQAGTYVAKFSMENIREGAFVRAALELAAVEYLARNITDAQLDALHEILAVQEDLVAAGDLNGFYQADARMHRMILSFTGFKKIAMLADHSWVQVNRARQLNMPTPGRPEETLREHRAIVAALMARDPGLARDVTRHHLSQLITYLEPLEKHHPELFEPPTRSSRK